MLLPLGFSQPHSAIKSFIQQLLNIQKFKGSVDVTIESRVSNPIAIPLHGIAHYDRFCLRYFTAKNCDIIANKEAIKYSRNCVQQNCFAKAFPSKNQ